MRILSFDFATKNCETDEDEMLQYAQQCFDVEDKRNSVYEDDSIHEENMQIDGYLTDEESHEDEEESSQEAEVKAPDENLTVSKPRKTKSSFDGVLRYVLGFAVFKTIKCEDCLKIMKIPDNRKELRKLRETEFFLNEKDFGKTKKFLCNPSDQLLSIFKLQFNIFSRYFPENKHIFNLKATLRKICIIATKKKFPEWFADENPCLKHRKDLLDYILKCLIKRNTKWVVKSTKKSRKYLTRLRYLNE